MEFNSFTAWTEFTAYLGQSSIMQHSETNEGQRGTGKFNLRSTCIELNIRDAKGESRGCTAVLDASPKIDLFSYVCPCPCEAWSHNEVTNEKGLTLAHEESVCMLTLLVEIVEQWKIGTQKIYDVAIKHSLLL